jgi:hypothetical protein
MPRKHFVWVTLPPRSVRLAKVQFDSQQRIEMGKGPRVKYTLEFKQEALRQIVSGQSVAAVPVQEAKVKP